MTPTGYTEDALVEQPAIDFLKELGWDTWNAYQEFDHGKSTLGRETRSEVVLKERLDPVMRKLNPELPNEAFSAAVEELLRDRSRFSMTAANREVYSLLKNGIRVRITNPDDESETVELVRIIDWENPSNNDFFLCSQLWVTGEMYTRRADLVGFVNGIPLVLMEVKAAHKRLETGFTDNIRDYKDTIPQLFWYNSFIIISNGSKGKIGSVSSGWEHFADWKKIDDEKEPSKVAFRTILEGVCRPDRLLDYIENFTVFQDAKGGVIKLVGKNHQYLGVNNAIQALQNIREREGKLGVFWHTQGSGKSVSMIFFAQKVLRKIPGNWTFLVVTDRIELDKQIYDNFAAAGVVTENRARASSIAALRELLAEDHRYVFSLIHKFQTRDGETHPVFSKRDDIIVITDEAHRSQYDTLAMNMRSALPNAAFIAFTGTPLMKGEELTKKVFGDYISIYDFKQSVEDGATVPLYYENRKPELQLTNLHLNDDIYSIIEAAELDDEQEKKLERILSKEYHLITREDRLDIIAKDLVDHFTGRGFQGKAMMISIDKATAIRMFNKVQQYWGDKVRHLEERRAKTSSEEREEIEGLLGFMKETDMAVVVSQAQNEIADMQEKGLDIRSHRKRMITEDLETKFKDAGDPLRLVFVCAMWITGFDVPSCSTLYLDKPMRNHTLMQTIARANRVYPGKKSGLIVDYAGVMKHLHEALAFYGKGSGGGEQPVEDKETLLEALSQSLGDLRDTCSKNNVDLVAIHEAKGFDKIELIDLAVDALLDPDDNKRKFLSQANEVKLLFKAILPDPHAGEFAKEVYPAQVIAEKMRSLVPRPDVGHVLEQIGDLLDRSIATEGYVLPKQDNQAQEENLQDLSGIDFEALAEKFKPGRKKTINERLKGIVRQRLETMLRQNRTRTDFMQKFQDMIEEYNSGTLNAEEFFRQIQDFVKTLDDEDQRGMKEQLDEEELAVFDILIKPAVELTAKERETVKTTARELLATLKKEKLVLDWRKRQQTRAEVQVTIEQVLDAHLPRVYGSELFEQKSSAVFQHIYEAYPGAGRSVYAA